MTIFKMGVRRSLGALILWSIIMSGLLAIAMFLYPAVGADAMVASVENQLTNIPRIITEIVGLENAGILSTLIGYFAFVFQFTLLFSMLYAAILGAKTLCSEESLGATEFLYAQPLTRTSVAWQKLFAAIVGFFLYGIIIAGVSLLLAYFFRTGKVMEIFIEMLPILLGFFFSGLVFISLGFFFSSFLRSSGESIPIMVAIVLITYILGLMGNIVSRVSFLVFASPLQYVNPILIMETGFDWIHLAIGSVVILLSIIFGMTIYKRKNFYC